jgi:hypothetical protein
VEVAVTGGSEQSEGMHHPLPPPFNFFIFRYQLMLIFSFSIFTEGRGFW